MFISDKKCFFKEQNGAYFTPIDVMTTSNNYIELINL